jgi:hypothetical protein
LIHGANSPSYIEAGRLRSVRVDIRQEPMVKLSSFIRLHARGRRAPSF